MKVRFFHVYTKGLSFYNLAFLRNMGLVIDFGPHCFCILWRKV